VWLSLDFEILPLSLSLVIVNRVILFFFKPAILCKLEGKKKRVLNIYIFWKDFNPSMVDLGDGLNHQNFL